MCGYDRIEETLRTDMVNSARANSARNSRGDMRFCPGSMFAHFRARDEQLRWSPEYSSADILSWVVSGVPCLYLVSTDSRAVCLLMINALSARYALDIDRFQTAVARTCSTPYSQLVVNICLLSVCGA